MYFLVYVNLISISYIFIKNKIYKKINSMKEIRIRILLNYTVNMYIKMIFE
jgi:hypothetical protein